VTISGTTAADSSKSASLPIIVAGTIASVSQSVSASVGGTIALPDGSSATIPPGYLSVSQSFTLSEVSVLPAQPPDTLVVGEGPSLVLRPSEPIPSATVYQLASAVALPVSKDVASTGGNSASIIEFSINEQSASTGLSGVGGMLNVTDTSGTPLFMPAAYTAPNSNQMVSFSIPTSQLVSENGSISSYSVSTISMIYPWSLFPTQQLPAEACWDQTGGPLSFGACKGKMANKRVVVLVHGMLSCAEDAFPAMATSFLSTGSYDFVLGFDYDWTQSLTVSGNNLATFLNELVQSENVGSIDIVAHSEGVPVSLYGVSQSVEPKMVKNFVGLAGPILGTPVASDYAAQLLIYYVGPTTPAVCPASAQFSSYSFAALRNAPWLQDLQRNSAAVTQIVAAAKSNLKTTRIFLAGGENQIYKNLVGMDALEGFPFGLPNQNSANGPITFPTPNDGIVGLDSALAFGSGLIVHPLPPFPSLFHTDLPSNASVIRDIQDQVGTTVSQPVSPALSCVSAGPGDCEGPEDTLFTISGTGFSPTSGNIGIYRQDPTGTVTSLTESTLSDSGGAISWTTVPLCSDATGLFSIFTFDSSETLASNNVLQTIDPCVLGTGGTPVISQVNPSTGQQGQQNLSVQITGQDTHFAQGSTTANFGSGITVVSLTVNSATSATTVVNIAAAAGVGYRDVSLATAAEDVKLSGGFTVTAGTPTITNVNPSAGQQGQQNLSVQITGQDTHFAQGSTTANFGSGITVVSLQVNSTTSATALLEIGQAATVGSRNVTLTTVPELAALDYGFNVTGAPGAVSVSPASVTVPTGGIQTLSANVSGSKNGVTWKVQEGASGGTIISSTSSSAIYAPPTTTGTYHVVATNADDSSQNAVATVTVVPGPSSVVLHSFAGGLSDGLNPNDSLIQATDGRFFGTTEQGGNGNIGTVFSMDSSGDVTLLHSFTQTDGRIPATSLLLAKDGNFYGTTDGGGSAGYGAIFKMDGSGNLTVLYSVVTQVGGSISALVQGSDGNFYGTTEAGGINDYGTIFKMDGSGNLTVLHSFKGSDGTIPAASLIQGSDGSFYGTTEGGGTAGCGTVFKMDSAGNLIVLHSFNGGDGCSSVAALIQATDGYFYGTTLEGGTANAGTAFRLDSTGNMTVLHSFTGPDGEDPSAPLIQASDGDFYGTTRVEGTGGYGTIFRMNSSGDITVLHTFTGPDGSYPQAGLLQGSDGILYGTTFGGGTDFNGEVFRLDPSTFSSAAAVEAKGKNPGFH
jgi:uncharacterized repeat protein (TIGR03803 family)